MLKIPETKGTDESIPTSFEKKPASSSLQKTTDILMWALTAFMFGSAIVFLPSFASGAMFLFSCISVPLEPVQSFLSSKGVKGWIKTIFLVILFVICIKLYGMR